MIYSRYEIKGKDQDWENVKISKDSKIVNILSADSTKKRKKEKIAAKMFEEMKGVSENGVYDPKGLTKKDKKDKKSKKAKH